MAVGSLNITLTLNNGQFTAALNQSGNAITAFTGQLRGVNSAVNTSQSAMTSFSTKVRHAVMTLGLARHAALNTWAAFGKLPAAIVATNAGFERMNVLLTNMSTGNSMAEKLADGNRQMEQLISLSKQAPFSIQGIQDAWVKLKSAGIDPANGSMKSLLDAVAHFGGTEDVLHRAAIAIQQMAGKGVISMEELRQQLGEAIPTAMQNLADSMGTSVQNLAKQIAKGGVQASTSLKYLFVEFERLYGGSGQKMMETFSGRVSVLKTEWAVFAQSVGTSSGLFDTVKTSIKILSDTLKDPAFRQSATQIAQGIATIIRAGVDLAKWMWEWRDVIGKTIVAIGGLVFAIKYVGPALTMMGAGINFVIPLVKNFVTWIGILAGIFKTSGLAAGIANTRTLLAGLFALSPAGWVGLIAVGVAAVIAWFVKAGRAADDAATRIHDFWQTANSDEIKKATEALISFQKQLSLVEGQRNSKVFVSAGMGGGYFRDLTEQEKKDLDARAAALKSKIAQTEADIGRARISAQRRELDSATERYIFDIRTSLDQIDEATRTRMELTRKAINDNWSGKEKGEAKAAEEYRVFREALYKQVYDDEMKILKTKEKELQDQLAKSAGPGDAAAVNARLAGIRDMMAKVTETYTVSMDGLKKGLGTKGVNKEVETLINELEVRLAKTREFIKNRKDAVEEEVAAETRLKQIIDSVANDTSGSASPVTKAQSDRVKQLGAELAAANNEAARIRPEIKATETAFQGLGDRIQSAASELELWNQDLTDGVLTQASTEYEKLYKWIQKTKDSVEEGRKAEFNSQSQTALIQASKLDFYQKLASLQQEERGNRVNLAMTEAQRFAIETANFRAEIASYVERANLTDEQKQKVQELTDKIIGQRAEMERMKTPMMSMLATWQDVTTRMQEATSSWLSQGTDMLVNFLETGKFGFAEFAKAILKDILKIIIRAMIAQAILSSLGLSQGSTQSTGSGWKDMLGNAFGANIPVTKKAKGGIVGPEGDMPLRRYAKGGVARRPQVALFGEGSTPEAYVPLPDGRSIPVTMKGGAAQQAPNVSVNVINQSGQQVTAEQKGGAKFDGNGYVLDVVLKAMNSPGSFRDSMRSAVR